MLRFEVTHRPRSRYTMPHQTSSRNEHELLALDVNKLKELVYLANNTIDHRIARRAITLMDWLEGIGSTIKYVRAIGHETLSNIQKLNAEVAHYYPQSSKLSITVDMKACRLTTGPAIPRPMYNKNPRFYCVVPAVQAPLPPQPVYQNYARQNAYGQGQGYPAANQGYQGTNQGYQNKHMQQQQAMYQQAQQTMYQHPQQTMNLPYRSSTVPTQRQNYAFNQRATPYNQYANNAMPQYQNTPMAQYQINNMPQQQQQQDQQQHHRPTVPWTGTRRQSTPPQSTTYDRHVPNTTNPAAAAHEAQVRAMQNQHSVDAENLKHQPPQRRQGTHCACPAQPTRRHSGIARPNPAHFKPNVVHAPVLDPARHGRRSSAVRFADVPETMVVFPSNKAEGKGGSGERRRSHHHWRRVDDEGYSDESDWLDVYW